MKHWIVLAAIALLGTTAVVVSELRKVDVAASPAALLYLVADTERELTRMPVSFTRMSDEDEIQIGDQLAASYTFGDPHKKHPEDEEVRRYLTEVGSRVAANAHRKLPYRFHYIPDKYFVNAFALPGGHVYVGEGLLSLMDSEDELATVIGHEIEHIDHYHCAERVQQEQALRRIPLGELIALPVEVFEAGYNKDQEMEADREGTRLAVEAGYSANGAIRMFEAFQRLHDEYLNPAKTPQQELSQVTMQTIEGYFRSHPLPSERIAQIRNLIASEGWPLRPERDLTVGYIFWTVRAKEALDAQKYPQAQQLATESLKVRPGQANALSVLAQAQFAQADFSGAAASYRKLLDTGWTMDVANAYALSLAAANPKTAVAEFRQWMATARGDTRDLQVPLAGLSLLAGDPIPATGAITAARSHDDLGPTWLGELGWWFYLAGDQPTAASLLGDAAQQRPDNTRLALRLAWVWIEQHRLADALQMINNGNPSDSSSQSERAMARAVARWQAQERDPALGDFAAAVSDQPEWENPHWVKALYSALVAQSVQQMQIESERRRKALTAKAH
jgi:beta-barrel assembly-enhancing protease